MMTCIHCGFMDKHLPISDKVDVLKTNQIARRHSDLTR